MHYVISDIHNDFDKFNKMLKKIAFDRQTDYLYILGDLFDRAYIPKPLEVYYKVLELGTSCTVIRGNHDESLADYIYRYLDTADKKKALLPAYDYNTFSILRERVTEVDLRNLADWIKEKPLQITTNVNGEDYLFAHAQTSDPLSSFDSDYYLMGDLNFSYLKSGITGYTSVCGHNPTGMVRLWYGDEYNPHRMEIWHNPKGNVYMIDCGCGLSADGRLACLRLEDKEELYV